MNWRTAPNKRLEFLRIAMLIALSSGFAAATALVALEIRQRRRLEAWPFERPLYVPAYLSARDAPLRWRFSPGKVLDNREGRNSLGLRNRELEPKKPGTRRILFLGDSLIWSGETSSGELYTAVLEHRLNSRSGGRNVPVEVINAGVPGYTTYQELEFLKIYGLDMKPDLVVLGFVFNDVYYKYFHRPSYNQATGKNTLLNEDPDVYRHRFDPNGFPGALFGWSYLAHDVVHRGEQFLKRRTRQPIFPFEEHVDFYLAWKSYGWANVRALIGDMKALLAERRVPLELLVFPISDQVNDAYRKLDEAYVLYPQRKIREICDEYAIPMFDLTDSIYRNGGTTLFRDYLHLNGKGNDIVADEIEKHLLAQRR
jgi:lysophospholipase L1-like esterase